MIRTLNIRGYRCFEDFSLEDLSRVNLFVGKNNSGKTSLLEALYLLGNGNYKTCLALAERRGEIYLEQGVHPSRERRVDIRHFFFGHKVFPKQSLTIESGSDFFSLRRRAMTRIRGDEDQLLFKEIGDTIPASNSTLFLELTTKAYRRRLELDDGESIDYQDLRHKGLAVKSPFPSVYLPTGRQKIRELQERWEQIALTDKEEKVIEASRIIEPRIQRLAFIGAGNRSRILVKLKGEEDPIPIGSLGDGVRRVVALASAMVCAEGGFLLIDEFETGLYYKAQKKVWDFLISAAHLLEVQLFVTTHSQDCLQAFAESLEANDQDGKLIRLSRRGESISPVYYSPEELRTTLKQEIEVR